MVLTHYTVKNNAKTTCQIFIVLAAVIALFMSYLLVETEEVLSILAYDSSRDSSVSTYPNHNQLSELQVAKLQVATLRQIRMHNIERALPTHPVRTSKNDPIHDELQGWLTNYDQQNPKKN